jgi:hypothetical protein
VDCSVCHLISKEGLCTRASFNEDLTQFSRHPCVGGAYRIVSFVRFSNMKAVRILCFEIELGYPSETVKKGFNRGQCA